MRAQQVEQAGSREHRRFHGLVANFYSLKTKTVPAGRVALGDRLGWAFLPNIGSGSCQLRGSWQQLLWASVSSRDDLGSRLWTCDLGMGLHRI